MRKVLSLSILLLSVMLIGCGDGSKHTVSPAALSLTSPAMMPLAGMDSAYSQTLTATGGLAPYSWSVATGSTLPAGLALNASTGALTGSPTVAGAFSFSITVRDSSTPALTATAAYSLSISVAPVVISTTSLTAGTQGVAYSQTLAAIGGTAPYTWSLASGSTLPGGLALSGAGVLSGTPTVPGAFNFSVTVTDASSPSLTATQALTLTIATPPIPPGPLAITTATLPPANVNFSYSASLAATGGFAPYSWSLVSGGLPGFSLDPATGIYSGTPTHPVNSPSPIQFQVTDAVGSTASVTLPITISAFGLLEGQYFFQANSVLTTSATGTSANPFAQVMAGSIALDGQGNVTAGSVDLADDNGDILHCSGVTGVYFLESDGTSDNVAIGYLELTLPGAPDTGTMGPVYAFAIDATARQQANTGYDTSGTMVQAGYQGSSTVPVGTGTFQLQNPTAFPGFLADTAVVFGWKGDTCALCGATTQALDLAAAGLLTFNSNHTLTNTSTADIDTGRRTDSGVALSGSLVQDTAVATGNTDSNFNLFGRSTLSLTATGYTNGNLPSTMVVYVIDAQHAYALTAVSNSAPLLAGFLQQQAASPSLSGNFLAWGSSQDAFDDAASNTSFSESDAAITLYTAAAGALTGTADVDLAGTTSTLSTAATFTVGSNGRVTVTPTDSNPAPVFWLTGPNTGFGITQPTRSAPSSLLTLESMTSISVTAASVLGNYVGVTTASDSYNAYSTASILQSDGVSAMVGFDEVDYFGYTGGGFFELQGAFTVQANGRGMLTETVTSSSTNTLFTGTSPLYVVSPSRLVVLDESQTAAPVITVYHQ